MKKVLFFLVSVLAIGLTSCNTDSVDNDNEPYEQGTGKDGVSSGGDKNG